MKPAQSILISLILAIGLAAISHAGEFKLVVIEEGTRHGHLSSDIKGDTLIVGAHAGFGLVKIYTGGGRRWKEQAELTVKPPEGDAAVLVERSIPSFGFAVDLTGPHELASPTYALVGAARDNHAGGQSGSAYVFVRNRTRWTEQAKLIAADAAEGDEFGHAISIDKDIAVIGAPGDDDAGSGSGSAYIFVRNGNNWRQQAKLAPADLGRSAAFGHAVLVNGSTVIITAPKHTHSGVRFTGAVYVFERQGDGWVQQAKLTADDAGASDAFGESVDMSGHTVIIGSALSDTERGKDSGAAYVFIRDGDRWKNEAKLVAGDGEKANQFGSSVAIGGSIAIVGAKLRDEGAPGSGAAYSFIRVDGGWEQKKKVIPDQAGQKINYGESVAMAGNTVIVSAHNAPNDKPESAHGVAVHIYNSVDDFGTPPFAVEPFGLRVTTLGQVKRTALLQNFPNPFNPETWLPYHLGTDTPVTLRIYNVQGQLTRELDLGIKPAGGYLMRETAAYWDGRDQVGETVSSGVYFYTLQASAFQATRRMLILK